MAVAQHEPVCSLLLPRGRVVLAAVGVFGTASGLPDLIVAGVMATLALTGAWQMWGYAQQDLRRAVTA